MSGIALLSPYAPPVYGGISTFISGLARSLRANGHRVSVLAGHGAGDASLHSDLGEGASYARRAASLLEEITPDVVHCHSHWYVLAAGVDYLRRNPGARVVFSFHTTPHSRWKGRFARLLRHAHAVSCVSAAQRSEVRRVYRLDDVRILRPATDLLHLDSDAAHRWGVDHGLAGAFPVLMFAGPLEYAPKVRGVLDLISSIPAVRQHYPATKLVILGDGAWRPRVTAEAAAVAEGAVLVLGFVKDLPTALTRADLYCHISYQEGLPLALLEAMSVGRPVLATSIGGIPEVIDGSNGLLVDGGAPSIAAAVRRMAGDPEARDRMGRAARATIERSYTWKARLPEITSLYGLG